MAEVAQPVIPRAGRPLSLIPVGLKEAALDSPTFRATAVHFADQVDIVERWLDAYVRSTSKLVNEVSSLEETINNFLGRSVPPANVSEAVLDHDYTLLAMKRFGEGSREWWSQVIGAMKKMEETAVVPIKSFLSGEGRNFKDARRYLDQTQKSFDATLARYLSQSKTKEASALREDAFQVHEARKAYLKASLDFCLLAPQLRSAIDKLLVRVSYDQWREMKRARENISSSYSKWNSEMDRVRGWSREMEAGESVFRRELQIARREIGETAAAASKPSRELEDYSVSTVAYLGSRGPSTMDVNALGERAIERAEKQGWLCLRTITGKPARTFWVRRWFYVKNGIFGWLVQGAQSGGVEESEKIGVLLCNVKPAVQEDRRFCFEVKTKNSTVLVQAETQAQLTEWLEAFEVSKKQALEANVSGDMNHAGGVDPAFAITPPSVPEFAAKSHEGHGSDDFGSGAFDRSGTLMLPGGGSDLSSRASIDVTSAPRRSITTREEGESSREHAARIMQKLDIHRKTTISEKTETPPPAPAPPAGGIASLISASHNILPVYSTAAITRVGPNATAAQTSTAAIQATEKLKNALAPSTLANPPAPTNLSKSAVIVSGERGTSIGRSDATGGMPSGIMANLWGSSNWGYINRLEPIDAKKMIPNSVSQGMPASPKLTAVDSEKSAVDQSQKSGTMTSPMAASSINTSIDPVGNASPVAGSPQHGKKSSVDALASRLQTQAATKPELYPSNYPLELKTQEAQFRMLFPNVDIEDKLVMVFRATWNPNEQQEFPGRVYVTSHAIYFYSHHMGLILISSVTLASIEEVTAAPGKDCDFIFLHLREGASSAGYTRVTMKTFLEPLQLLQSRLNYLVDSLQSDVQPSLSQTIEELIRLEDESTSRSPSLESWEDVSMSTPVDDGTSGGRRASVRKERDLRTTIHVEHGLQFRRPGKEVTKFQLPSQPVIYEPPDMQHKVVERDFDISPKALFHVLFGDKSIVFQLLYHERRAQRIAQGPWLVQAPSEQQQQEQQQQQQQQQAGQPGSTRREMRFQIDYLDVFRRTRQANVVDFQVIEVLNEHVCYVVRDYKTPWHLPNRRDFMLVSSIAITHVAKSRCRLTVHTRVQWSRPPAFGRALIERQALEDTDRDALDLAEVAAGQVGKLGARSRTKKAVHIFGSVSAGGGGDQQQQQQQQTTVSLFPAAAGTGTGEDAARRLQLQLQARRPQIERRTLAKLLAETGWSLGESVASSLMLWAFAALRKGWRVASAHSLLLGLLLLSVAGNLLFTSRDASEWWAERGAAGFMRRMGVGPNVVMSKAVYVADLWDGALAVRGGRPAVGGEGEEESACYSTFSAIANLSDLDAPYQQAGSSLGERATRATARRLRRTRQRLGVQRHDLLVAVRAVNRVELEVMRAEWENWLLDENTRCRQAALLLSGREAEAQADRPTDSSAASGGGGGGEVGGSGGGGGGGGGGGDGVAGEAAESNGRAAEGAGVDALQQALGRRQSGGEGGRAGTGAGRLEELRKWHAEYCGSCAREQERWSEGLKYLG